jgi:hypothetical protein
MPTTQRRKVLRYRRAVFNGPGKATAGSLEDYLTTAHKTFKTVDTRRATSSDGYTLEVRSHRHRRGVGVLLHLAAYTTAERASVVPLVAGAPEAPVSTVAPPARTEFMDGDLQFLIAGNDVVLCSNALRESRLGYYCSDVFSRAGLPPIASMFSLVPVADANALQLIENEGVKAISLRAASYEATGQRAHRKSARQTSVRREITDGLWERLSAIFENDPELSDIQERENLSAEIIVKFDGRKKGGEVGQERIETLAKRLLEDEEDGFTITTRKNNVLGHNDIALQKVVYVPAAGKSVQTDAAFHEMTVYYGELGADGHLDN